MFQHFHINLIFLQNEDSPLSFVGTNTLQFVSKKEEMVIEKEQVIASGKSSLDVLNLTTNDANKALLEPSIDFPLSNDECFIDLCDKEELCDSAIIILIPQLVKETDSFVLDQNTCAENKKMLPIASEKDELKLLSSLNTLDYIEFDNLCTLSSLK